MAAVVGPQVPQIQGASLLVFPFENLSQQRELDYICIGTADELLRRLTYVERLQVYPVREPRRTAKVDGNPARFSLKEISNTSRGVCALR